MIREVGESIGRAVLTGVGRASSRVQERKSLSVDLLESDDAYLAVFDAPGATAGDVQVRFEGDTLHVQIDRFREFHEGYEMRFPGRGLTLHGELTIPDAEAVDADAAEATLTKNGTLEVHIPKVGEEVDVESGAEAEPEVVADADADE
ncbi:MAG: HSP20 family protein [Natronomonas sp.]|jgi:HSP20 family protein|uniref:Hsp20 family protein n=1 Tax=Natronomonas sp. TaxID=2184060 RepID=UPI003988C640